MDQESFESVELSKRYIESILPFLKEQQIYNLLYWDEMLIDIQPPIHMFLLVTETTPGVRGDTAQGAGTKSATCETGLVLQVPLFIQINDLIKVDTRTNEYVERMKK